MALSWIPTYRALLLLSGVIGIFLLYMASINRDKPGARPIFILVVGALVYVCAKLVVSVVSGTPTVFVVTRFNPLGAGIASVGFFLLVVEYTGIENPVSKRTVTGLLLIPAVVSALVWIDLEYLWIPLGTDDGTLSGYAWEFTSVAIANQLYMNLLLLVGLGLLIRWAMQSPSVFTMQVCTLILAAMAPLIGNLAFQFGYVPFNLAPVMFVVSGVLIAWAILWAGFLNLAPIGQDVVVNQFDAGVLTLNSDHRVVDINERGCQLFNVEDADRVVGQHIDTVFAGDSPFRDRYWAVTGSDSKQDSLIEFNGGYYTLEVIQLHPTEKTMLGRSVIIRDVTEQKEREQAIGQAREKLRQIVDLIPDPLYVKNMDDEVLLSNEANAELHGMMPEQIEGRKERDIESEVENIENFDHYRQREIEVVETGEPMTFEEEMMDSNGERYVFQTTRIPFEDASGDEDAVLGYARDVTDLKQYEQELEQSNEKLEQFASVVSHDLRNPLNVISGRVRLIDIDRGEQEHLDAIERSAERMETMIGDLLALSRAGQEIDEPETVPLASVARDSWDNVQLAETEFELDVPDHVTVEADRDRLSNVFENLFRNTREHNEPPLTVRVGVFNSRTGDDKNGSLSGFFVEDDGEGIPEENRDEIFDHGYTTNKDGTGFGLSIVQEVIEAHGWSVSICGGEAGGARFEITDVDIDS